MKKEILVTGATGFLGRRLVAALEARGFPVRKHASADGDIANCLLPMEGVGHVFHLAGKSYVPDSWKDPHSFYHTNVMGTVNVLEHCRRHEAALTLVSSYVYGQPQRLPIGEDHPLSAANPYAHTKLLAEDAARFYERTFGLKLVIVRPFNVYGPGQQPPFLIPSIVQQVLDTSTDAVHLQDLRPKRDYLYIDDAVDFFLTLLRPGIRGVFNMGSGRSASVAEVAQLVNDAAGIAKPVMNADVRRPGEVLDVVADISRAASELGWRPRTSLAEGIAAVVAAERAARG
jgi:nucleoside-diphosphate-sugar epimerase